MGVDHALTPDAEREHVLAAIGERRGRHGQLALTVLLGEERRAGGDAAEDRDGPIRGRGARVHQRECARGAPGARTPLERALALERPEMVESRPRRDLEPVGDLAHGRRRPMPRLKAPHETQDFLLLRRQLAHADLPWLQRILNGC